MGFNRVFVLAAALLLVGACAKPNDKLRPLPKVSNIVGQPKIAAQSEKLAAQLRVTAPTWKKGENGNIATVMASVSQASKET